MTSPTLAPGLKGYPHTAAPLRLEDVRAAGWNVLAGDLPLPIALLKREALEHNLRWMQARVDQWGIGFAPHGKTTMSPQLFKRQIDAGAWGITFANVTQLAIGVAAGVSRALIANQVMSVADLRGLAALFKAHADLRALFLVDSIAQLELIEAWAKANARAPAFEVLMEIGYAGGRTGCRTHDEAVALAERLRASRAVRLVGLESYEGTTQIDADSVSALMDRVDAVARACVERGCFEADEVIVSSGGSAVFDLVAGRLKPMLGKPVRGLLRSGCYITHDHGFYEGTVAGVEQRIGCPAGESLRAALEVWALVQSRPEPGLAILGVGKRDISFDLAMPVPIARAAHGSLAPSGVPAGWKLTALNDQHAYLRWDVADEAHAPVVGDRIGLGVSHPCTTFDKWHWMPIVESDYRISDAVTLQF
ncbi:alanine racemase [Variovorax sp. PAMC 28711]|uniref:alanine racemase n=1 Tax=Variovorax sp. PAMC 28711 TaxID=1795631 RepID=UPI00078C33DD|nr:alanine racemase [Variovorax sp. PAMC 28711]AMM25420.1 amino acid deaminase [Variovorax sp. PAMC 28711]